MLVSDTTWHIGGLIDSKSLQSKLFWYFAMWFLGHWGIIEFSIILAMYQYINMIHCIKQNSVIKNDLHLNLQQRLSKIL